jgi:amino acid adenylation domain-containing protein/thioester reductase-like protein
LSPRLLINLWQISTSSVISSHIILIYAKSKMEQIILTHAQHTPDALAIEEGSKSLTYAELVKEASCLSKKLRGNGTEQSAEDTIGILLGPGIKQVVAQVAIRLAGGICVPMEPGPSLPDQRMISMLHDVGVKRVVVDMDSNPEIYTRALESSGLKPVHISVGSDGASSPVKELEQMPPDRSHILFTSGSTGKPKPVQIRASGILHLADRTPMTPLKDTDRVAEFNNPGFDLSLFEIWATLIAGATIVVIPRHIATDPNAISTFIEGHGVTIIIITAALFDILAFAAPMAFHTLRHVLTAGDVANVRAVRNVLESGGPPQHLWNTYGPTECTTLTTMFEVTLPETRRDRISIGRAVGDMEVFLLDKETLIEESGQRGEICIAGPQQCAGYWGLDAENEASFIDIPRANLGGLKPVSSGTGENENGNIRLYRTGDLAEWQADSDSLDFVGRQDNQVKHKGFRIELGEIERTLHLIGTIHRAVVVQQPPLSATGTQALIAFVVVDPESESPTAEDLINFMTKQLPVYMVPDAVRFTPTLPLTATGKVDRRDLVERCFRAFKDERKTQNNGSANGQCKTNESDQTNQDTKRVLQRLWCEILNKSSIEDGDDFFILGGTSLQAASLIAHIHDRLDRIVTMENLTGNSRLEDLYQLLKLKHKQTDRPGCQKAPDDSEIWMGDIDLVDDIELVPCWDAPQEGRVFLTGTTGFVGAHLLCQLMMRPTVKQIACLVRSKDGMLAATRIQHTLERYNIWPVSSEYTQKILVIEGDIGDRTLGLGADKFAWLANWASVIFHLGAKVNFCESYHDHRTPNVVGTSNMLRLVATGRRQAFHYMSTIDVWGTTGCTLGTDAVYEDGPLQPHIQAVRYDLGYSQSQWTAESMVRRMRDRGLPIAIYRPGFVIGNPDTGSSNPADFVSRLLVGCIQMGTWPRLIQRLEYVTVDYVVDSFLYIAADAANLGRSYSLVAPNQADSVTVIDTCRVLNDAGYPVRLIDYDDWVQQVDSEQRPDGPLAPLLPNFQEKVLGPLTRWTGSQYSPWYRADQAKEVLQDRPDIAYRALDGQMVQRFIKFWNEKGFYNIETPRTEQHFV